MDLFSDKVPSVNYSPDISNLFDFFTYNWLHLWPAVALLLGVLFGTFIIRIVKNNFF